MTIFEKIIKKEVAADFLYENESAVIINDKFPQENFHFLVLPKKKYINLQEFLNKADQKEILEFFDAVKFQLNKFKNVKVMFNCGEYAEIEYMHCHIISNDEVV